MSHSAMSMLLLLLTLASFFVNPCDAFALRRNNPPRNGQLPHNGLTAVEATRGDDVVGAVNTVETKYDTTLSSDRRTSDRSGRRARLRRIFRKKDIDAPDARLHFTYDYYDMTIGETSKSTTTAVLLLHPIGVGIGKWYYDRLLRALHERYGDVDHRLAFVAPDLLGSATASGPTAVNGDPATRKMPLLNVTDWTEQAAALMAEYEAKSEEEGHAVSSWSVVTNGGCSPIALQLAALSLRETSPFKATLTNVILSSPPRLPFFFEAADPAKVRKSYRTLSGAAGRLFWWYSLRREGRFVRQFSEKNLVGDAAALGEKWTPNCVAAARLHGGRGRYSTFAFLAGALQDGCAGSLDTLRGSGVAVDFIRGTDGRRNRAKSWFWQRKKGGERREREPEPAGDALQQYFENNGNRGKKLFVGGRISLAWEDAAGYATRLMELLCE